MPRIVLSLIALVLVPLPDPTPGERIAKDLAALHGSWKVVAIKIRGGKYNGPLPSGKWTFSNDRFTMGTGNGEPFKLDPTKNPKHIDIGEGADRWLAIYQVDKDALHLCWGPAGKPVRPTDFAMKDDAAFRHLILKRDP